MNDRSDTPLTGGCTCEAVRFELAEPPVGALYCHCKRCQRRTGSAFSVTALAAPGTFRLTSGEDTVKTWSAGDGWSKAFCGECGGHVFTQNPDDPSLIAVRMGALDEDPGIRPAAHQFTDYAAPWHPIPDDGLPRFPERITSYEPPAE